MTATQSQPTSFTTEGHVPVLIEDWLPIRELGIESVRESAPIPGQFPKIKTLHVWWARAPLGAANGIVLAALLPTWDDALIDSIEGLSEALSRVRSARRDLQDRMNPEELGAWYRTWVLWMCGIRGDAVHAKRLSMDAKKAGNPLLDNPFTWPPAFRSKPSIADLNVLHALLWHQWGRLPRVLDPTAGGGSIPYTALRYGLPTWANDLNAVASGVLEATLHAPSSLGPELLPELEEWGGRLVSRCSQRLAPFFPNQEKEEVANYLFANTVSCPRTGGPVPLSPNWWLDRAGAKSAIRFELIRTATGAPSHIEFHVEQGPTFEFDPDAGTVRGGAAVSPWDGLVVSGDYIKAEAQAGRMWPTLYCVRIRKAFSGQGRLTLAFRAPTNDDLEGLAEAEAELGRLMPAWERDDIIPTEDIGVSNYDRGHRLYGIFSWRGMFTPRQQLVHGVFIEEWRRLLVEARDVLGAGRAGEVMRLLAMMQGKALTYNSRQTRFDPGRGVRNAFEQHNFSLKWTFGEFEGAKELYAWCLTQLVEAYGELARLLQPATSNDTLQSTHLDHSVPGRVTVTCLSAANLAHLDSDSIDCVNIDPPYYDNVQYSELSDFFYVWEKRTLGLLVPDRYKDSLTNRDDEAVANVARFADAGARKKELAAFDYQRKMQAIFAECHRVLVDDGVMVVWFTHKRAEAWDTLGTAMMDAGFTIEASWPVATQSEASLHHAKKNSAKSTVILVCRKRRTTDFVGVFFEDIEAEVRRAAENAVAKFEADVGVGGVDLMLATYGPTLSVISRNWPVLSSEAGEDGRTRRLRPEEALAVARQEVARLRMARLVGHEARFDPASDFWLMAWETFRAREFPYDEARKLALGVGYDVDAAFQTDLLTKKSGNVALSPPSRRVRRLRREAGDDGRFDTLVDALHFMLNVYEADGLAAARTWLSDSGYDAERAYLDILQAAVRAVPRVRTTSGFSLDEARALDEAVVALFGDEVELPRVEDEARLVEQTALDV